MSQGQRSKGGSEGSSGRGLSNWGAVTYPSDTAQARTVLAHSLLLWEGEEEALRRGCSPGSWGIV